MKSAAAFAKENDHPACIALSKIHSSIYTQANKGKKIMIDGSTYVFPENYTLTGEVKFSIIDNKTHWKTLAPLTIHRAYEIHGWANRNDIIPAAFIKEDISNYQFFMGLSEFFHEKLLFNIDNYEIDKTNGVIKGKFRIAENRLHIVE